uniref:Uncharacterized protein AlNc14C19G2021 n=1 Tax=Albugo laibachii Nc14 TaxID=890382 RepID=F0W550_9STRA|nr:conserved hypothetical protein [Albugo laibachii Nc14]|eukprot:CCA16241.1 conserved hypothetical protein [Albugo laibachii Nc14]
MRRLQPASSRPSRPGAWCDVDERETKRDLSVRGVKLCHHSEFPNRFRTLSELEQENERKTIEVPKIGILSQRKTSHKLNRQRRRGSQADSDTGDCASPFCKSSIRGVRSAWTCDSEEEEAPPDYESCIDAEFDKNSDDFFSGDETPTTRRKSRSDIQTEDRMERSENFLNNQGGIDSMHQFKSCGNSGKCRIGGLNAFKEKRKLSWENAVDLTHVSNVELEVDYQENESFAPSYDESFYSFSSSSTIYSPSKQSEDKGVNSNSSLFAHDIETTRSSAKVHDRRPCSAFALASRHIKARVMRPKSARPNSTARVTRVVQSFFEQKHLELEEKMFMEQQAAEKLDRAKRGKPPVNLLERQKQSAARKEASIQEHEEKLRSIYQQVKARDVPATTYRINCQDETERRNRIMKRSQDYLLRASLPSRMAEALTTKIIADAIKAEKRDSSHRFRSKPVPDFDRLHRQWERNDRAKKGRDKQTIGDDTSAVPFFQHRQEEYEALRQKRLARKKRISDEEIEFQQAQLRKFKSMMTKIIRESSSTSIDTKLTKSDHLRRQELKKRILAAKEREVDLQQAQEVRERRLKLAKARIKQQVELLESQRRDNYPGTYIDLQKVKQVSKDQAKLSKASFHEALAENRKRIMEAVATQPTLMERFVIDLKKEEYKKQALASVVKNVICASKLKTKEILSPEEEGICKQIDN